jgi:hypothetical protein
VKRVKKSVKTLTQLSKETGTLLAADMTETTRFASMDLCQDILVVLKQTRDQCMRDTLRSWIGKLQTKYQSGPIG